MSRRGQLCRRHHAPVSQRRDHSQRHPRPGHLLETGQARDHQSRSGVCQKKNRRGKSRVQGAVID
jgi:hypothetical protein